MKAHEGEGGEVEVDSETHRIMIERPLPGRYITDEPGVGGVIKARPEDFLVEEIPLYEPSDHGEHLFLRIQKTGRSHGDMLHVLSRYFGVSTSRIGYAGMKDKHAVTSQSVTIQTTQDVGPEVSEVAEGVEVLWATRHERKLRRGHLAGNRFSIRIREIDPLKAPSVLRTLRALEQGGVPNYFGHQRFGYRSNNHVLGALLLRRAWGALLDEMLGSRGSGFPENERPFREAYDEGAYEKALGGFGRGAVAERAALQALRRDQSVKRAALSGGKRTLSFWANAAQSAIFNALLDARIDAGKVDALEEGDLAWKHDARAVFSVDRDVLIAPETQRRLASFEISPSGPLWSSSMIRATGAVDERERRALAQLGLSMDDLADAPYRLSGARRPFRVPVRNPQVEGGFDEHGPFIRVAFDLPRGSYATVVLREIMKNESCDAADTEEG